MTSRLSIVIPAHNEGPLVRTSIARMLEHATPGEFEVVVVANGCTDDTAAWAGSISGVRVIEIDTASKVAALNAGDASATVWPRAYIDADVAVSTAALRALADSLHGAARPVIAAPALNIDTAGSSVLVRAYYRVWALSDYRLSGHVGSGIYAVNAAGRDRWGRFPDVIADDRFVQARFRRHERVTIPGHVFTVAASRDMATHIRRGVRIERGNRQLQAEAQLSDHGAAGGRYGSLVRRVIARPSMWPAFVCYIYGFGMTKVRARIDRATPAAWARDDSLRRAARA